MVHYFLCFSSLSLPVVATLVRYVHSLRSFALVRCRSVHFASSDRSAPTNSSLCFSFCLSLRPAPARLCFILLFVLIVPSLAAP